MYPCPKNIRALGKAGVFFLFALGSLTLRAAEKPFLPPLTDACVAADQAFVEGEALPFFRKHLVESFEPAGMKAEEARRVRAVREGVAQWFALGFETKFFDPFFFPTALAEEAQRLFDGKCQDPGVWLATTIGRDEAFRIRAGVERLATAHGRATGVLRLLCALQGRCMRSWARQDLNRKHLAWLREDVEACKAELQAAPPRVLLRLFAPDPCHPLFSEPGYDPALRACLDAVQWGQDAFKARGTKLAAEVTPEGWDGWETNLDRARLALKVARALRPQWAEPWMLSASYAQRHGARGEALRQMAKGLSVSSLGAEQLERVAHYLTSRWGGSTELLLALADAGLDARTDTMLPYRCARSALKKANAMEPLGRRDTRLARLFGPRRQRLYAMADAYLAQPDSVLLPRERNVFAVMGMAVAVELEDWDAAARYRAHLKAPIGESAFDFPDAVIAYSLNPPRSNFLRALATTTHPEQFFEAERALSSGDFAAATARYEGLLALKNGLGRKGHDAIEGRLFAIRARQAATAAGFVSLMPTAGGGETAEAFPRIIRRRDGLAVPKDGRTAEAFPATLLHSVGRRFEARVHFLPSKQKRREIDWGIPHALRLRFVRDAKGDRWELQRFQEGGRFQTLRALDLERKDTHTFAFDRTGPFAARVMVDGRPVELPEATLLDCVGFRDSVSEGWGEPLSLNWRLTPGTAFSDYGARPIPSPKAIP